MPEMKNDSVRYCSNCQGGCCCVQVIAFIHTVLKRANLGLQTVLIVVPVNVLHNWRSEFGKWQPAGEKPVAVYMLEDVSRLVL